MERRPLNLGGIFRPGMRGYFIPLVAGVVLTISAFLPWVIVDGVVRKGISDVTGLWIAGLGALAAVLAVLSLITRKNSRHPLLVVGLAALGIMFLAWRVLPRLVGRTGAHRVAGDRHRREHAAGRPAHDAGGQRHLRRPVAAASLVGFGLTIVVKRAAQPYVLAEPDDDVP